MTDQELIDAMKTVEVEMKSRFGIKESDTFFLSVCSGGFHASLWIRSGQTSDHGSSGRFQPTPSLAIQSALDEIRKESDKRENAPSADELAEFRKWKERKLAADRGELPEQQAALTDSVAAPA